MGTDLSLDLLGKRLVSAARTVSWQGWLKANFTLVLEAAGEGG